MSFVFSRTDQTLIEVNRFLFEPEVAPSINMLTSPAEGQILIDQIHEQIGSMVERFKAVICRFSSYSQNYLDIRDRPDFEQIFFIFMNEWDSLMTFSRNQLTGIDTNCCCSHPIENLFYVKNLKNGNVLLIGSDCIKKFSEDTELGDSFSLINKLIYTCKNCQQKCCILDVVGQCCQNCSSFKTSDRRACKVCFKLTETRGYNKCKSCWKAGLTPTIDLQVTNGNVTSILQRLKICPLCEINFFAEEDWKTYCKNCYMKNQGSLLTSGSSANPGTIIQLNSDEDSKECEECGNNFFAKEDWKTLCLDCYRKNKALEEDILALTDSKPCQSCKKEFKAKEDWKTVCVDCYRKNSRACIDCHENFQPKFSSAIRCYTCYLKTKK